MSLLYDSALRSKEISCLLYLSKLESFNTKYVYTHYECTVDICIGTAIWTSTYPGLDKHVIKYFYDAIIGELPTEILYFSFLEKNSWFFVFFWRSFVNKSFMLPWQKKVWQCLFSIMDYGYVLKFLIYSIFHCIMCANVARWEINWILRLHFHEMWKYYYSANE